ADEEDDRRRAVRADLDRARDERDDVERERRDDDRAERGPTSLADPEREGDRVTECRGAGEPSDERIVARVSRGRRYLHRDEQGQQAEARPARERDDERPALPGGQLACRSALPVHIQNTGPRTTDARPPNTRISVP